MSTHRAFIALAAVASVLAVGCAPVIVISTPDRNKPYDPVTTDVAVVNFTSNFKPTEAWYVDLDGTNLTSWSPAPMPGGTSSQAITITPGQHTVTAQGTCGTFCSYNSDKVTFAKPSLVYNSITLVGANQDLPNHVRTTVFVGTVNYPSTPFNVTVREVGGPPFHVKLAPPPAKPGDPPPPFVAPGDPLTVKITDKDNRALFDIEGDVLGFYRLHFTCPGCFEGFGGGTVK